LSLPARLSFAELKSALLKHFHDLESISGSFILAVNQEYVSEEETSIFLQPGDEVAVIPPISGGNLRTPFFLSSF
jgi:molybdopterin converting factor small subunit